MKKAKQMRKATKRVARRNANTTTNRPTFWGRVWNIICIPFRWLGRVLRRVWNWIRNINLVDALHITLLVAIIILFSVLIIEIVDCNRDWNRRNNTPVVSEPVIRPVSKVLPVKKDASNKMLVQPINVVPVKKDRIAIRQTAKVNKTMYGDVIVDSRGAATMLSDGATVKGNLYLQNMHKYTLPCDIKIEGNLFLRDMGLLQFCGDFTITGNIYVSPRSSFGPVPRTARLGGQVIL